VIGVTAQITLETETVRAVVDPEAGAHVSQLSIRTTSGWYDILYPGSDPGCGAFPLVPFSGRILNGHAGNAGRVWQAPPHPRAGVHAMHGDGWKRRWSVLELRDTTVKLGLDYPTEDWPFDHSVNLTMTCAASRFSLALDVSNGGEAPFGLGWHPFMPMSDRTQLEFNYSSVRRLQNDLFVEDCAAMVKVVDLAPGFTTREFAVTGTEVLVKRQDSGPDLRMEWTGVNHLVVYVHPDSERFAIEPANHAVGVFHRSGMSRTLSGLNSPLPRHLNLSLSLTGS
jgi:galactose mutarotase-like enzyme